MKEFPQEEIDAARKELEKVRDEWLRRPGVTAVDIGYRIKDGRLLDELAIRAHVKRKLPLDEIARGDAFPENLGAFPVDVIEAEYGPESPAPEPL